MKQYADNCPDCDEIIAVHTHVHLDDEIRELALCPHCPALLSRPAGALVWNVLPLGRLILRARDTELPSTELWQEATL